MPSTGFHSHRPELTNAELEAQRIQVKGVLGIFAISGRLVQTMGILVQDILLAICSESKKPNTFAEC